MTQKTCLRSSQHIQVKCIALIEHLLSWIISLANASYSKFIFAIKTLSVDFIYIFKSAHKFYKPAFKKFKSYSPEPLNIFIVTHLWRWFVWKPIDYVKKDK